MSQTTTPSGDLLETIEDAAICLENWGEIHEARDLRAAVKALIARNAELEADLRALIAEWREPGPFFESDPEDLKYKACCECADDLEAALAIKPAKENDDG